MGSLPPPQHPLFVYGTLQPGEAYYPVYCAPYLLRQAPARVIGRLYHLPVGYPAMTVGESRVQGTLLWLRPESWPGAIAALDEFEGCDPKGDPGTSPYQRQLQPAYTPEGTPLGLAWVYTMAPERVRAGAGIWLPEGTWSRAQWPTISPDHHGTGTAPPPEAGVEQEG